MQQRELKLESLTSTGAITGLDVSPDGRSIVFGSTVGGVSQVFVLPIEGGDPVQITHEEEGATTPKWSPRGDLIAFLRDIGGDENYQIYVTSPDGSGVRDVTNAPGKLHENISWSRDGKEIACVSNRGGGFDVYVSDVASGQVRRVTNYPAGHHAPTFSPDGSHIAFCSNRTDLRGNWDTFVVPVDGGEERMVTGHEGEADEMSYYAGQMPYWSADGRRILVASSVPGNYDIMAIDVETLNREWIADSEWDEGNAQWSPDGSRVAYVVNEDGNLVVCVKDLSSGEIQRVSHAEGVSGYTGMRGKGGDYRWTPDGQSLVYSYSGPTESGSIWIVSADGRNPRCLYSTLPADIQREWLVKPWLVHYTSFDGRQISAFLWRPEGTEGKIPAIIMPHGGPTGQTVNGFNPMVQYLVSRGYAILAPNFRGSTGYGSEFQWLNRNDWGGGDLEDVVAGRDWLIEQGISDRIGITGGSYGGYMTMRAITHYPDLWDAAVAIFPMVDLEASYRNAREDMRQFQVRNIGTPEDNTDLYHERSPINFVERITTPLLILQGDRDARCRLSEVLSMRDRLQACGRDFELVVYEHEGHGFSQFKNRLDSLRRTADFFDRHLVRVPASVGT